MYGTVDKRVEIYKIHVESNVIDSFGIELQCVSAEKPVLTYLPNPKISELKEQNHRIRRLVFSEEQATAEKLPVHVILGAASWYSTNQVNQPPVIGLNPDTDPGPEFTMDSHPERFVSSGTLRLCISDHDLIYIVRKQRLPKPNVRSIEYRSMKNFDEPAFLSSLSDIPWGTAYTFDDVNDIWCHWESLLKQAIDNHAPLKRVNLKSNHLRWINPAVQKQMRIMISFV